MHLENEIGQTADRIVFKLVDISAVNFAVEKLPKVQIITVKFLTKKKTSRPEPHDAGMKYEMKLRCRHRQM